MDDANIMTHSQEGHALNRGNDENENLENNKQASMRRFVCSSAFDVLLKVW